MLLSLDSGVSALDQFQQQLNVVGNNIANVNTVGFKSADVNFADALSQTLGSTSAGSTQVGSGVLTASITNQFTQGSITSTGVQTDMAVNGNGFFLVKDPSTGASYVTRDGEFTEDTNGYLVTSTGMRVQGYTDAGLTTQGDIQINNTGAPAGDTSAVQSYTFGSDGKLSVQLADGTQFTRGQILLQNFTNPEQLLKVGNNLFSAHIAHHHAARLRGQHQGHYHQRRNSPGFDQLETLNFLCPKTAPIPNRRTRPSPHPRPRAAGSRRGCRSSFPFCSCPRLRSA